MEIKYLDFIEIPSSRKTKVINVISPNLDPIFSLGYIKFYPQWRKYIFEPAEKTIFDENCLKKIAEFCSSLTIEWRKSL